MTRVQIIRTDPNIAYRETWELSFDFLPRVGDILDQDPNGQITRQFQVTRVHHGMSFGRARVFVEELDRRMG